MKMKLYIAPPTQKKKKPNVFYFVFFAQRFIQYLASRNTLFNLSNFLDKSGLQGTWPLKVPINHPPQEASVLASIQPVLTSLSVGVLCSDVGYDMSTFIRRYSRYLNEKAVSYRQVAFDFTKVKRG